jgi:serine/threonine-protein kinase RsbW
MVPEPDDADESTLPIEGPQCVCRPTPTTDRRGTGELWLDQSAVPPTVRVLRTAVRAWAIRAGLEIETVEAVVLAVDEAVTNAVEHAHASDPVAPAGVGPSPGPGRVTLGAAGRGCGGGVAVAVGDDGTWQPPADDPGHRGRGVQLIGRLADRSTITTSEHGTCVRMCWAGPTSDV